MMMQLAEMVALKFQKTEKQQPAGNPLGETVL
jgi:hypothetical protein